ncbi:phenol 2-monooxygenase (NADPH), partial [Lecanoromycetidae sp. Uapishka_2]
MHTFEDVDVLIIGSGPTGLMLANCFNYSNIKYRMVEKKGAIVPAGQADSMKVLTMQMFDSMGISNLVDEGACQFDEVVFWDPIDGGEIYRSGIVPDKVPGLKAIREVSLNQGKIESLLLGNIRKHRDLEVEYSKVPSDVYINEKVLDDHDEYPFVVMLHPVDNNPAEPLKGVKNPTEIALASVAGSRESTDFPDIRKNCVIRSAKYGNMMMIPHTHSPKAGQGMNTGMQDAYNLGWKLLATMQKRLHPRILSTYESERRPVAEELINFDRGYAQSWAKSATTSDGTTPNGTASSVTTSNTTTSKGNTSKEVTSNGTTSNGTTPSSTNADNHPVSFQTMYKRNMVYTTGILIHYPPSGLVVGTTGPSKGPKAVQFEEGLTPGMRLPDFQILNQSDAVPTSIHKVMTADGRFRVLVFAGDLRKESQAAKMNALAADLASQSSFVNVYKPSQAKIDERIEIITIHASPRNEVELQELPEILHPWNEELGWDYWKVYADDQDIHGEHGGAYRKCAIEDGNGRLVVVRPDGYVGMVAELTHVDAVNRYFSGFMIPVLHDGANGRH